SCSVPLSFVVFRPPPSSTLFPYTTLFRSWRVAQLGGGGFDGFVDLGVLTATTDVARQRFGDLGSSRIVVGLQQRVAAHDEATREIGRAHVLTPVTRSSRMPSSA